MSQRYLTIFTTVYNLEPYLHKFFEQVNDQSFKDYELLILDDGSTDNSLNICKEYAEKDDRIRIIELEHMGISAARNVALQSINTEFATSLDGDDYFDKDYLKHLVDAQKKYDADLVISNVITYRESMEELWRFVYRKEELFTKEDYPTILPKLILEDRITFLYGKLYRTEYLKDVRVEENVPLGSDLMIACQYVLKINSIVVIEDYDYHYVKYNKRTVTSVVGRERFFRYYRMNKYVYDLLQENGLLNDEMIKTIDTRIIAAGRAAVEYLSTAGISKREKYKIAHEIIDSEEYMTSYNRQINNLDELGVQVVNPGEEIDFLKIHIKSYKRWKRHSFIKKFLPNRIIEK